MRDKLCCALLAGAFCLWMTTPGVADDAEKPHAEKKAEAEGKEAKHAGGHDHVEIGAEGVSRDPSEVRSDLAIFTFIVFLLLLAILWKFAWGPITAALDKREEGIRQDIAAAEQARIKAEQMLKEHEVKLSKVQEEVRDILAEARRDAEHTKQDIISDAQKEAEATKRRSIAEIERATDNALKDLFDAMAMQVTKATERVLNRTLSVDDQHRLVEEALAEFSKN